MSRADPAGAGPSAPGDRARGTRAHRPSRAGRRRGRLAIAVVAVLIGLVVLVEEVAKGLT